MRIDIDLYSDPHKSVIKINGKKLLNVQSFKVFQDSASLPVVELILAPDEIKIEGNVKGREMKVVKTRKVVPKKRKEIKVVKGITDVSDEELGWSSESNASDEPLGQDEDPDGEDEWKVSYKEESSPGLGPVDNLKNP